MSENNIIIGFVENLMFTTRIESILERVGFEVKWGDSAWGDGNPFTTRISQISPVAILIDLDMPAIPPLAWIQSIKSNPETQNIPVICFGSHKNVESLKAARQAGADQVVARSKFFISLPELIQKTRLISG